MKKRNQYEVIMVIDANLTDEESQVVFDKHKETITGANCEIKLEDKWGRRKLAYEIQKQRYGIYYLLYLEGDGDGIEEMELQFGYDDKVIKFFVVKVDNLEETYNKFITIKEDPKKNANLVSEKIGA